VRGHDARTLGERVRDKLSRQRMRVRPGGMLKLIVRWLARPAEAVLGSFTLARSFYLTEAEDDLFDR